MRQKFLLLAMAMLGCFHVAQAEEGILTISDGTVQQGWYGCVTVNAKNFTAKTFNGFQMEVVLPKKDNGEIGLHFDKMVVDATATGYIEPEVSFNDKKGEENFGICMVFSLKDAVFNAGDFELCKIYFHADEDMPTGNYTLNIHGISMSGVDSQDHPVTDIASFNVEVTERTPRVLDENAEEIPEPTYITTTPTKFDDDGRAIEYEEKQLTEDVTVKRTIKANTWSTFCLPFEITQRRLRTAMGLSSSSDISVATFPQKVSFNPDEEGSNVTINFVTLDSADPIQANIPYLIKVSKDIKEFSTPTNSKVQVNPNEKGITMIWLDEKESDLIGDDFFRNITIMNVYNKQTIPEKGVFLSGNKFYASNGESTIKGFRNYIMVDEYFQNIIFGGSSVNINVTIDDEPTYIEGISTNKYFGNDNVYSVSGIYMGKASDMKKFPQGMYIVNGKKVVKK